jgi:23S rRNA pseudouridine1911/1915/1917 synthase
MKMPIIYEDADVVVVDKPAGMLVHADGHDKGMAVCDWFAKEYPASNTVGETQTLQSGEVIVRPGVVHRLDRETTGVLVLAKTQEAYEHLKTQFKERLADKTYIAITYGVPKKRKGVIDFSIGRSRKDFRLRSAQPKAKGMLREALTHYVVLADDGENAVVAVTPKTGRTHQIRVHLKAIHHPVVCDKLYAPKHKGALGLTELALHAYKLELVLPSGKKTAFTAPFSPQFTTALEQIPGALESIAKL